VIYDWGNNSVYVGGFKGDLKDGPGVYFCSTEKTIGIWGDDKLLEQQKTPTYVPGFFKGCKIDKINNDNLSEKNEVYETFIWQSINLQNYKKGVSFYFDLDSN
jgi:hypothetical protein